VKRKTSETRGGDAGFQSVVDAFTADRRVTRGGQKGFGTGALKVKGKIFAMMSSKGQFVVKLSTTRVDALVASGEGARFEPRPGRPMKEWLAVGSRQKMWIELAREAYRFVSSSRR
jgi:hypothetical protein